MSQTLEQVKEELKIMETHNIFFDLTYTYKNNQCSKKLLFTLHTQETPLTCNNFLQLVKSGKYEGSIFHRIIPNFMIQGGDYEFKNGTGGKSIYGDKFKDENFIRKHQKGCLSMANAGKNTNGSQFFITVENTPWLDGKHVVFGQILNDLKDLNDIVGVDRDSNDRPIKEVKVIKCGLVEK